MPTWLVNDLEARTNLLRSSGGAPIDPQGYHDSPGADHVCRIVEPGTFFPFSKQLIHNWWGLVTSSKHESKPSQGRTFDFECKINLRQLQQEISLALVLYEKKYRKNR